MEPPQSCTLCPRRCGANRRQEENRPQEAAHRSGANHPHEGDRCPGADHHLGANRPHAPGLCGGGARARVAHSGLHHWEEPCISGTKGSGTVFFAGCPLGCVFCQNHEISRGRGGRPHTINQLAALFLELQAQGAHNLNLVTPTHYRPWIKAALAQAAGGGLGLPVVWNTGGYERAQAAGDLADMVSVWLADLKFFDPDLSRRMAGAGDYFKVASAFLQRVCSQTGPPRYDREGLMQKGVLVRILVLPGEANDAIKLLEWMAQSLPAGGFALSLMSQYTPPTALALPKPLNRRLSRYEYKKVCEAALELGFENVLGQHRDSAGEGYVPGFEWG